MIELNDMFAHLSNGQLLDAAAMAWALGDTGAGTLKRIRDFLRLAGEPELAKEVGSLLDF
jgi:hypothetical protein